MTHSHTSVSTLCSGKLNCHHGDDADKIDDGDADDRKQTCIILVELVF